MTAYGNSSAARRPVSIIKEANNIMALTIALKALAGGVLKMDSNNNVAKSDLAEVFIVHNNTES